MAWTAPRTWVPGELVTASMMNTHIRDNESYIKANLYGVQQFRGLRLRTSPDADKTATTVVLLHADEIVCSDSERRTPADNLTADITVAGIGGLRASQAEAASTWYKVMYCYGTSGEGLYLEQAKDYFLDQTYTTDDAVISMRTGATTLEGAQGFKVDTSGPVPFVDVKLIKVLAPTGKIWAEIRADSGGDPAAVLATSDKLDISLIATSVQWVRFIFRTPAALTAATQYHLVVNGDNAIDAANYVNWRADSSAPSYPNGQGKRWNGATWDAYAVDMTFSVYVTRNDNAVAAPAGYDSGYAHIGWVYNDSGSNFVYFNAQDRDVWHYVVVVSSGTVTIPTLTSLATIVPPVPVRWTLVEVRNDTVDEQVRITNSLGSAAQAWIWTTSRSSAYYDVGLNWPLDFQHFYYYSGAGGATFIYSRAYRW